MHVELSPELSRIVRSLIESGEFRSVEQVLEAALLDMVRAREMTPEKLARVREEIRRGIESAEAGHVKPAEEVLARIRADRERRRRSA